jgi:hypothetical protein
MSADTSQPAEAADARPLIRGICFIIPISLVIDGVIAFAIYHSL